MRLHHCQAGNASSAEDAQAAELAAAVCVVQLRCYYFLMLWLETPGEAQQAMSNCTATAGKTSALADECCENCCTPQSMHLLTWHKQLQGAQEGAYTRAPSVLQS